MKDEPISREKRWIIFLYVPLTFVAIMVVGIIFDSDKGISRVIDIAGTLALNILAFAWCRVDSYERSYKLHRLFPYAMVLFGTLALIYYLFRSRGFPSGLVSVGWLVLYAVCAFVLSLIVSLLILIPLVFSGILAAEIFD